MQHRSCVADSGARDRVNGSPRRAGVYKLALLSLVYRGGVGNGCCRYLLVRCRPQLFAKEVPQAPAQCYLAHLLVPLVDVDWSTLVGDTLFLSC
jgi:hypothetical protein